MSLFSHRITARITGFAATILLATGTLSACGSGSSSGAGDTEPQSGGTLKLAFWPDNAAFSCVDPFQVYWLEHRTVIRNIADSLTDQDTETGEIVPWLATEWQISPDGLTYTFTLREDATFSDGTPVDAEAVKANVAGWIATADESSGAAYGSSYILGLIGADVIDAHTVQLNFSQPNSSFLQATSTTTLALITPASFENSLEERCLGDFIASGPFTLESYSPNELTRIVKRDDYAWGSELSDNTGAPYLDAVEFTYVAEDSVRTGNLTSGAVDIAWPRNPFTVEDQALIESSGASIESRSLPGPSLSSFPNVAEGRILSDASVRQALYHAIDVETYAATIYGEDYPVVQSVFDESTPYFSSQADKLDYNQETASDLLDGAGWELDEEDGYRYKDGQRLTISKLVTATTPGEELLQDQLKQVGIELTIDVTTQAERPAKLAAGSYDLTDTYFTRADPGALQFILDPDLANSRSLAENASTPQVKDQIKAYFASAIQTTDAAQSEQAYADLQALLIDEGVMFPIAERVQYAGVSPQIHGFAFTPETFLRLNDVWKSE